MPWGFLSLNVDSGKTWCASELLSILPDRSCYTTLHDRLFPWWNQLNPTKMGKKDFRILDPVFRDPGRIFGIFLESLVGWRTKLSRKWSWHFDAIGYNRINITEHNKLLMHLPYFGQDLDSKKKVFVHLAHVWWGKEILYRNPINTKSGTFSPRWKTWVRDHAW